MKILSLLFSISLISTICYAGEARVFTDADLDQNKSSTPSYKEDRSTAAIRDESKRIDHERERAAKAAAREQNPQLCGLLKAEIDQEREKNIWKFAPDYAKLKRLKDRYKDLCQ
jgi:hypothetical protein